MIDITSANQNRFTYRQSTISGLVEHTTGLEFNIAILSESVDPEETDTIITQEAVDALIAYLQSSPVTDIPELLFQAVTYVNSVINQKYGYLDDRCTLAVALIDPDQKLYVANVGHSRIFLLRKGKLYQLTLDHTLQNLMQMMGRMSRESVHNHEEADTVIVTLNKQASISVDIGIHTAGQFSKEAYAAAQKRGVAGLTLQTDDVVLVCSHTFLRTELDGDNGLISAAEISAMLEKKRGSVALEQMINMILSRDEKAEPAGAILQLHARSGVWGNMQNEMIDPHSRNLGVVLTGLACLLVLISILTGGLLLRAGPDIFSSTLLRQPAAAENQTTAEHVILSSIAGSAKPTRTLSPTTTRTPLTLPATEVPNPTAEVTNTSTRSAPAEPDITAIVDTTEVKEAGNESIEASKPAIVSEQGRDDTVAATSTTQPPATATPSPEIEANPTEALVALSSPTLIKGPGVAEPTATRASNERSSINSVNVSTKLNVYLREGPGTDYNIVSIIPGDSTFQVQARSQFGNWYFGEAISTGQKGWIWADYAETTEPEPIEALPTTVDIPVP